MKLRDAIDCSKQGCHLSLASTTSLGDTKLVQIKLVDKGSYLGMMGERTRGITA